MGALLTLVVKKLTDKQEAKIVKLMKTFHTEDFGVFDVNAKGTAIVSFGRHWVMITKRGVAMRYTPGDAY